MNNDFHAPISTSCKTSTAIRLYTFNPWDDSRSEKAFYGEVSSATGVHAQRLRGWPSDYRILTLEGTREVGFSSFSTSSVLTL